MSSDALELVNLCFKTKNAYESKNSSLVLLSCKQSHKQGLFFFFYCKTSDAFKALNQNFEQHFVLGGVKTHKKQQKRFKPINSSWLSLHQQSAELHSETTKLQTFNTTKGFYFYLVMCMHCALQQEKHANYSKRLETFGNNQPIS